MGEFIKGWRRKTGVLTLLMACVFTVGWVRSCATLDVITVSLGGHRGVVLVSGSQKCLLLVKDELPRQAIVKKILQGRSIHEVWPIGLDDGAAWAFDHRSAKAQLGTISQSNPNQGEASKIQQLPYWCVVMPLTLLSFWLLLFKPRTLTRQETMRDEGFDVSVAQTFPPG